MQKVHFEVSARACANFISAWVFVEMLMVKSIHLDFTHIAVFYVYSEHKNMISQVLLEELACNFV